MNLKKTLLTTAMTAAMGLTATTASADWITVTYDGWFTLLNPSGVAFVNADASGQAFYGNRTAVTGTMMFDTTTGAGTGSMAAFSFGGGGNAAATNISFQGIGDGMGGSGPLVLGNLGFNWSGSNGIPVSIVLDASGFFNAVGGGLTTSDIITGGSLAASEGQLFGGRSKYTLPMGPGPIVTTTWNTTDIGTITLGDNPSGTLPLIADTTGGSPMAVGPFPGWNANFDILNLHVKEVVTHGAVPVPAAVWLFGSGLLGLVGVARRRKKA